MILFTLTGYIYSLMLMSELRSSDFLSLTFCTGNLKTHFSTQSVVCKLHFMEFWHSGAPGHCVDQLTID